MIERQKFENLKMRTFKNLKKIKNLYFLFSVPAIQNVNMNKQRKI